MEHEFKAIIEKNLPAQVGDVLKKRLEQADKDAADLSTARKANEDAVKKIDDLNKQIADYKKFDERNSALEAREKACEIQERDLKVKTLEYQLQSEKDKTVFAQGLALGLVRNTEFKRTVFDTKNGPEGVDQYGNTRYVTHAVNVDEKKTAE